MSTPKLVPPISTTKGSPTAGLSPSSHPGTSRSPAWSSTPVMALKSLAPRSGPFSTASDLARVRLANAKFSVGCTPLRVASRQADGQDGLLWEKARPLMRPALVMKPPMYGPRKEVRRMPDGAGRGRERLSGLQILAQLRLSSSRDDIARQLADYGAVTGYDASLRRLRQSTGDHVDLHLESHRLATVAWLR